MTWTQLKAAKGTVLLDGCQVCIDGIQISSSIRHRLLMFPVSWGQKEIEAYNSLMLRFFGNVLGRRVRVSKLPCLLAIFDLDSIGLRRRAMANRSCIRMNDVCEDESDAEQRERMRAMNILRELNISIPFRKLIGNSSRPLAGDAFAAMWKRNCQVLLDMMKRPMVLGKVLCLALRLPNGKHRRLTLRRHFGTFQIHYRFL